MKMIDIRMKAPNADAKRSREPLIKSRKLPELPLGRRVLPGVMARRGEAVWRAPHNEPQRSQRAR